MKPAFALAGAGIFACLFLCTGCNGVTDVTDAWNRAGLDPALEGAWKRTDDSADDKEYTTLVKKDDCYVMIEHPLLTPPGWDEKKMDEVAFRVKTLQAGGVNFAVVFTNFLDSEKKKFQGGVVRYAFENGNLALYTLQSSVLDRAIKEGRVKGTVFEPGGTGPGDPPVFSVLDQPTLDFLAKQAENPKAWDVIRFKRVKDPGQEATKPAPEKSK